MVDLKQVQERLWANKLRQGFNTSNVELELNFAHEELSEVFAAYRKELADVDEEIADVMLYTLSLAKMLNVDVEAALEKKLAKNETRVYRKAGQGHVRIEGSE